MKKIFLKSFKQNVFKLYFLVIFCFPSFSTDAVKNQNFPKKILTTTNIPSFIKWNSDSSRFSICIDERIEIFDGESFEKNFIIPFENGKSYCFSSEKEIEENSKNDIVLGVSEDNLSLWELPQKNVLNTKRVDISYFVTFEENVTVNAAAISEDSDFMAVSLSDGNMYLYFKLRFTKELIKKHIASNIKNVRQISFSPDGLFFLCLTDSGKVYIFNTVNGEFVSKFKISRSKNSKIVFSNDSKNLFALTKKNTISIMNIEGNVHKKIYANKLRDFVLVPDDSIVCVLTTEDCFDFYEVESNDLVFKIQKCYETPLLSFCFSKDFSKLLTSHEKNSVCLTNLSGVLKKLKKDFKVEDNYAFDSIENIEKTISEEGGKKNENGIVFIEKTGVPRSMLQVGIDFIFPNKETNYPFGTGFSVNYLNSKLTSPFYFGAGVRTILAFPCEYPLNYKSFDGNYIESPKLIAADLILPFGIEIPFIKKLMYFLEIDFSLKTNFLTNPQYASSKPVFSVAGTVKTGISWKFLKMNFGVEFDSIWGVIPQFSLSAFKKIEAKK